MVLGGHTRVENPTVNFYNAFEGSTSNGNAIANAIVKLNFSFAGCACSNLFKSVSILKLETPVRHQRDECHERGQGPGEDAPMGRPGVPLPCFCESSQLFRHQMLSLTSLAIGALRPGQRSVLCSSPGCRDQEVRDPGGGTLLLEGESGPYRVIATRN